MNLFNSEGANQPNIGQPAGAVPSVNQGAAPSTFQPNLGEQKPAIAAPQVAGTTPAPEAAIDPMAEMRMFEERYNNANRKISALTNENRVQLATIENQTQKISQLETRINEARQGLTQLQSSIMNPNTSPEQRASDQNLFYMLSSKVDRDEQQLETFQANTSSFMQDIQFKEQMKMQTYDNESLSAIQKFAPDFGGNMEAANSFFQNKVIPYMKQDPSRYVAYLNDKLTLEDAFAACLDVKTHGHYRAIYQNKSNYSIPNSQVPLQNQPRTNNKGWNGICG